MIINQIIGSRNAIKLVSVEITKAPNKTNYTAKELFDSAGMEVKAIYSNGATRMVTDYVVESDALSPSDTSVVIKFTECGVTVTVNQAITVEKIKLAIPVLASGQTFVYTGSEITPTFTNYDSSLMGVGGTIKATDAGTYEAVFILKDAENYQWDDGSIVNKPVSWTISKANVAIPVLASGQTLVYTGSAHNPTFTNYNNNLMIGSNLSATNAGDYNATFTLKDTENYQWSDGTIANKSVSWTINKATATVSVDKTSVTLNENTLSDTVQITSTGMSNVTVTSSNTGVATATVSGNVITINNVNKTSGTATITLSGTPDSNHNAPSYPSISVNTQFIIYLTTIPSPASSYIYTGSTITPTWNNYDSNLTTIGGTTNAVNVGTYTATFTVKDDSKYRWSDGSVIKYVKWTIKEDWATVLKDFDYTENSDYTATITGWKGTYNGSASTEVIIPNKTGIKL